jgi:Asp-tRNA(Asn)/Glu-tRNA(Gln) amidotransferase A subunit family amidase
VSDWLAASIPRLSLALRGDELPLQDYVGLLERRMKERDAQVRAFLDEPARFDRLRRESDALLRRYPASEQRPPLFGVAVGVKDIFHVDGFPTRAGSRLPPEVLAGPQAECVGRLMQAGALVLGKTVTTEFAYFAPGPTRNPRRLEHTPGGSSSGSAAAVAAGLAPLAVGTQTIGSVIRPAAFCGVVGFKPTFGRVSTHGVIPLAPSLDHVGWFAADVAGAESAARVLCRDWKPAPADRLPRLGVPDGPYLDRAGESARAALESAAEALSRAGYLVRRVPLMPDFDEIARRHQTILAAEAARVHAEWFRAHAAAYHPRTSELIVKGQAVDDGRLREALAEQARFRLSLLETMDSQGIDAWISPSAVGAAPRGLDSTGDPIMNLPWTQAGLPALTVPCGADPEGLPLGLQMVAGAEADESLLLWGAAVETLMREAMAVAASRPGSAVG